MDSEEKRILRDNLQLSKENHKILKKMQRNASWSRGLRIVYWLVIIGGALGAYYYIQPFVDSARDTIANIQDGAMTATNGVTKTAAGATEGMNMILDFFGNFFGSGK